MSITIKFGVIDFGNSGIPKIIRSLSAIKAYGHDDILVRIMKMWDKPLLKPLPLIFRGYIDTGVYPDIWKKSDIVPVHKKF